jgi:hemoglobin
MALYDELGGGEALEAALDRFYEKVMADPPVAAFFEGLDVQDIKRKQKQFWTISLGGNSAYDGRDISTAHRRPRGAGLDEALFDRFVGHFRSTLEEFGVPEEKIRETLAVTDQHKAEVLRG